MNNAVSEGRVGMERKWEEGRLMRTLENVCEKKRGRLQMRKNRSRRIGMLRCWRKKKWGI